MYFININITKHVLLSELENEKANVSCCFTWIADIKLNLAIVQFCQEGKIGMTDLLMR